MARARQAPSPDPEDEFVPPYYRATQDIYFSHPEAGTMPVCGFRKGDPVPSDTAINHKLGGQVEVPAEFEGGLPLAPEPDPEPEDVAADDSPPAETPPDAG
jgi:hypothetical protein